METVIITFAIGFFAGMYRKDIAEFVKRVYASVTKKDEAPKE